MDYQAALARPLNRCFEPAHTLSSLEKVGGDGGLNCRNLWVFSDGLDPSDPSPSGFTPLETWGE